MAKGWICGAAMLALAAGCSPIIQNHGYVPNETQLAGIAPGVDTVQSVSTKIGRPSTGGVVRSRSWYYVASRVETLGYRPPEIVERKVVAIDFDENGVVASVEQYGLEDGRIINLVTKTTPTYGRRMGVLEQIFGNIGNIAPDTITTE